MKENTRRLLRCLWAILGCCMLSLNATTALANSAQIEGLEYHTEEDIRNRLASHTGNQNAKDEYEITPSADPYATGKLSKETLDNTLEVLNNFRYIAGISYDVTCADEYNTLAQLGAESNALIDEMTHFPPKPQGVPDAIYEQMKKGASSSNLAQFNTTAGSILGWLCDADGNNPNDVGHRNAALNPKMTQTGFGAADGYTAMYVYGEGKPVEVDAVVWPAQTMPVDYFLPDVPWSVTLDESVPNDVSVRLTRERDGKEWVFSYTENDGFFSTMPVTNTIIFRPLDIDGYQDNDVFDVTINGLASGTFHYTVRFFDLTPVQTLTVKEESMTLKKGDALSLMDLATTEPEASTSRGITWTSSDESILSVKNDLHHYVNYGSMKALKGGDVVLTASTGNGRISKDVMVHVHEYIFDDTPIDGAFHGKCMACGDEITSKIATSFTSYVLGNGFESYLSSNRTYYFHPEFKQDSVVSLRFISSNADDEIGGEYTIDVSDESILEPYDHQSEHEYRYLAKQPGIVSVTISMKLNPEVKATAIINMAPDGSIDVNDIDASALYNKTAVEKVDCTASEEKSKWGLQASYHGVPLAACQPTLYSYSVEKIPEDGVFRFTITGKNTMTGTKVVDIPFSHKTPYRYYKAATCEEAGESEHWYCSRCRKHYAEKEMRHELEANSWIVPAIGHNWEVTGETPVSCEEDGAIVYTCTNCQEEKTEVTEKATGHSRVFGKENIVEATCETNGGFDYVSRCSKCGKEMSRVHATNKALGHDWDEGTVTKEAKCEVDGEKTFTCSRCEATRTEVIPMLVHQGGEPVREVVPATCQTEGYTNLITKCTLCGEILETQIEEGSETPVIDHLWEYAETIAEVGCETDGVTKYICSACGEVKEETIKASGHQWSRTGETAASCTDDGAVHWECTACGNTRDEVIPAKGHTEEFKDEVTPASCKEDGYTTRIYSCSTCREELRREIIDRVESSGHNKAVSREENRIEPTCEQDGSVDTVYYCSGCGIETGRESKVITATGHSWDEGKVTKDPSCTEAGTRAYTCRNNPSHIREEEIKALGHTPDDPYQTDVVEASCEEDGSYTEITECKTCGEILSQQVLTTKKTGHKWDEGKVTKEPSCTEAGTRTYTCRNNPGHTREEEIKAPGHMQGAPYQTNVINATCEKDGSYTEITECKTCHEILSKQVIAVKRTGHKWDAGKVTKEPTCTEDGIRQYTCQNDSSHTKSEIISALGHNSKESVSVIKEASCETAGVRRKTVKCTRCGKVLSTEDTAIPAVGHKAGTPENDVVTWADCEQDGLCRINTYCTVCSKLISSKEEKIPKTGHKWDAGKITKEATCSSEGVKTYTCQNDSSHIRTEKVAKKAHVAGDKKKEDVITATCEKNGSYNEVIRCRVCSQVLSEKKVSVPATGHNWDAGKIGKAATVTEEGRKDYTCKTCGKVRTEAIPKLPKPQGTPSTEVKPADPAAAPKAADKEKEILSSKSDEAPAGSSFGVLQLRLGKASKNKLKLKWTKVKGATGYIIYGAPCGSKYKKLKVITKGSSTSWTHKKLKKGKYYKYYVMAVQRYQGADKVIASSKTIHVATSGGKAGNYKSVKLTNIKKNKIVLKAGKSFTVKWKEVPANKKLKVKNHRKAAFESSNAAIATVAGNGKITAKKKGTCIIYVYAQSGVFQKIQVTVQ